MSESSVEILDLGHRPVLVGELQQIEVRVGDHHVLGLSADPAAHVHVPICGAGPGSVDVQADAGVPFLAIPAAPAGDVEGHRDEVSLANVQHVAAGLNDFAGDFVAQHQPRRRRRAPAHHVLV